MTAPNFPDPAIEFERIICGLDTSPQSLEGAEVADDLRAKAEAALKAARQRYPSLQTQLVEGEEKSALGKVAERQAPI